MKKLCTGIKFDAVSPEIICAMLEHTQRLVTVTDAGEIEFKHEGRLLTFANPNGGCAQAPGKKLLAYCHLDDPRFLHLTDGNGAFVGTWIRRALVRAGDRAALNAAIEYANSALKHHKETTAQLNVVETVRLDEMRERNNQLLASSTFIDVAEPRLGALSNEISSPIATTLVATQKEIKRKVNEVKNHNAMAKEALSL